MSIKYTQQISILAAKAPSVAGAVITEKDFEISPAELLTIDSMNESNGSRYSIADGVSDQSIGMGTVALGRVLIVKPTEDLQVKIVNSEGTGQLVTFKGGTLSVVHIEFTDLLISNSSGSAVTGKIFIAGD